MKKLLSLLLCLALILVPAQLSASAAEVDLAAEEYTANPDPGLPENDELFAAYAEQTLYGTGISTFGIAAGSRLTGDEKAVYDALVPIIKQIAAGERSDTIIGVGQAVTYNGTDYVPDVTLTFSSSDLQNLLSRVVTALLSDYPYEMYWYDKVTGCKTFALSSSTLVYIDFKFTVATNYGTGDTYTTNTSVTKAASAAAANALEIVKDHASASDYNKLLAYKQKICTLVSYDHAAAEEGNFSGNNDPWQLISVFDGDTTTNVVCEGYSKAFMYLCDLSTFQGADTACYTVSGTMGGGAHMWNIVTLEGENYLADVTNSDSGSVGQSGGLFLVGTSGSPANGYTFMGYPYLYGDKDLAQWGTGTDSILTLASEDYSPVVHTYESIITAPTCTTQGYTTHTCSDCGSSYIDSYTPALGHDLAFSQTQTAPTCEAEGTDLYCCTRCDYSEQRSVASLGHSYASVITAPTCEDGGCTTHTCSRCGDTYTDSATAPLGHSYEAAVTAPTCTVQGYSTHTCSRCGDTYVDTYTDVLGHDLVFSQTQTAPTCDNEGSDLYRCTRCDYTELHTVAPLGHSYEAVVTAPTCVSGGYTTHTCSRCGDAYTDSETAALGHAWDNGTVTTPATEETEGVMTYTCTVCKITKTEGIPTLDHVHSYDSVITAPTCTEDGYTTHTCRCGDTYVDGYTDALGHDLVFSQTQAAPTCEAEGSDLYCCTRCEHTEHRSVAPLGHNYESVVSAPTCEDGGYTTHTCSRCGDTYADSETAALGHTWDNGTVTTPATEETEGVMTYTCTVCKITKTEVIPTLDHVHSYDSVITAPTCTEQGYTTHTCRCGDTYVDAYTDALGHDMSPTEELKAPTCTSEGTEIHECDRCGKSEFHSIPALGHDFEDGSCTVCGEADPDYVPEPPDAVTIKVSCDASTGKPKVTWKASETADSYDIYRRIYGKGSYTKIDTTTDLSYLDEGAKAETKYTYYVIAVGGSGVESDLSNKVSCTCDLAQPVMTLTNVASSGKIKVSWEKVDGAAEYKVYRATSKTGTYSLMKTTTSLSYTNTSATAGKTYYYKVRAIADNTAANSAYSEVKSRTCDLARPSVTLSNVASTGKIKVTWKAIDGAVKYQVYRAESEDGEYKLVKTTTGTSYTNTSAEAGNAYYYKVMAIASKSSANSAYSTVKSRTCDLERPDVTIKLKSGKPRLTWDEVEGAVEYKVYRATSKSGTYSLVKTTTNTSYTNTGAKSGKTYYYKVKAIAEKSAANSAYSSIDSIKSK